MVQFSLNKIFNFFITLFIFFLILAFRLKVPKVTFYLNPSKVLHCGISILFNILKLVSLNKKFLLPLVLVLSLNHRINHVRTQITTHKSINLKKPKKLMGFGDFESRESILYRKLVWLEKQNILVPINQWWLHKIYFRGGQFEQLISTL